MVRNPKRDVPKGGIAGVPQALEASLQPTSCGTNFLPYTYTVAKRMLPNTPQI